MAARLLGRYVSLGEESDDLPRVRGRIPSSCGSAAETEVDWEASFAKLSLFGVQLAGA